MNQERNTIHTKQVRTAGVSALVAMTLAFAPAVLAGVTPEQKCEAGKNGAAGKYASCLLKAQSKFVKGGKVDTAGYDAAVLKCDDTYGGKWQSLETKADGMCPSTGDETSIQDFLDACILSAQNALGGDTLPSDVVACNADLGTCTGSLGACTGDLGTCNGSLDTCHTDLSTTNADLGTCSSSLGTCSGDLGTCNSSLTTCSGDLTTCQGDLSSTNANLTTCEGDLAACEASPVCGDGLVTGGEQCDVGDLNGETCATRPGFTGGTLGCATGCTFDTTDCYATRFDASGATIIDHETGLEWEKKDSAGGGISFCPGGSTCANPHDVDNVYQWSSTGTAPDGRAFTDFLDKLNGNYPGGCYAGHCDWRLPTIEELQGEGVAWPANAAFLPNNAGAYWSASTGPGSPSGAWYILTQDGSVVGDGNKAFHAYVRAVRSGS